MQIKSLYNDKQSITACVIDLYSTYLPNILYAIPADVSKFLSYELLTDVLFGRTGSGEKLGGLQGAVAGALAGMISQVCTTPLDVVRTRLMAEKSNGMVGIYKMVATFQNIQDDEGLLSLFQGSGPRVIRALLSGSLQFFVYEITQNLFR
jgi:hypothetical protein